MADERFISKHSSTEIEAMLDKVKEDMRVIQYSQAEINTLLTKIDGMTQPTKVSDINNDLGFIDNTVNNLVHYYTKTNTYTKDEVNALITAQTSGGFISVNTLPTEDISVHHIYLVPSTNSGTNNIKDEYINLDGTSNGWELIGSTQLDLSNYVSITALNSALLDYVTSTGLTNILNDYYTKTQADGLFNNKTDKVSSAISGHLAALDSNGNLTDAGKALSDLQEKLTAGNGITINPSTNTISSDVNYLIGAYDIYDDTERIVGYYYGKPLYKVSTSFTWGNANTPKTVFTLPTAANPVAFESVSRFSSSDKNIIKIPHLESSSSNNNMWIENNAVIVSTTVSDMAGQTGFVTIYYTKTTDSASSVSYGHENEYSDMETIIGTWFGKPLYQKGFSGTWAIDANQSQVIGNITNLDSLIDCKGFGYVTAYPNELRTIDGANGIGYSNKSSGDISIKSVSGAITWKNMVVTYTKTTD